MTSSPTNRSGFQAALKWLRNVFESYPTMKPLIWLMSETCQKLLHKTNVSKQRSVFSRFYCEFKKKMIFVGTTWWYFGLVISQIQYSGSRIKTGQQYSDRNPFLRTETNEDTCQNGLIINRNASFCAWGQRRGKVWQPPSFISFFGLQWIWLFFRLENGWFVRDVPSPVQSGGTSSLVSSSPPSENEFELNLNHNESSSENYASSSKSTKKVYI